MRDSPAADLATNNHFEFANLPGQTPNDTSASTPPIVVLIDYSARAAPSSAGDTVVWMT